MPKITDISYQKNNKNRCNLFVDDEFFAGISLETLLKNRLRVGQEIVTDDLKNILAENERQEALTKAISYVSKTLKTKKQVKTYLIGKGYSEEVAYQVIDKLKEYNYVDDQEYSKRYIESTAKTQGKRLIQYKLMMKGVKKEDIECSYDECDIDEYNNAKCVLEKYLKNKEITKENLQKGYRYLLGKGFSYDQASFAISALEKDD